MGDSNLTQTMLVLAVALLLVSFLIYLYLKNKNDSIYMEETICELPIAVIENSNKNPEHKALYESLSKETYK